MAEWHFEASENQSSGLISAKRATAVACQNNSRYYIPSLRLLAEMLS